MGTGHQDPRAEGEWEATAKDGRDSIRGQGTEAGGWATALPWEAKYRQGSAHRIGGKAADVHNLWRREGRRWLDKKCLQLLGSVCAAGAGEGQRGRSVYREWLGKRAHTGVWGGEHRCLELFVLLESEFSLGRERVSGDGKHPGRHRKAQPSGFIKRKCS